MAVMTMKHDDVARRLKLLRDWDYLCIICGHGFDDISSVSIEHLVPKSMGGNGLRDNKAPTHYACNELRGTMSLLEATRWVARKRRVLGAAQFQQWLQRPIPSRVVPIAVWKPIRPLGCLELPERLPGL